MTPQNNCSPEQTNSVAALYAQWAPTQQVPNNDYFADCSKPTPTDQNPTSSFFGLSVPSIPN